MNYFDLEVYMGHGNISVNSFGSVLWSGYYIIAHSSNSTLLVRLDPPDSLLQMNYLQNIKYTHNCFFTC